MREKTNLLQSVRQRIHGAQTVFHEFPGQFWILVSAAFIDRLGGAMMFPFFTLYLTRKFGIGMTQVGVLFGLFALSGLVGSVVGGALTDRLGRKGMLIFGLVMSALSSLLMGTINEFSLFFLLIPTVGLLADAGGPAQQALVADLLPEDKRAEGFGILRVAFNLAVVFGPLVGGLLAAQSYLLLFIADAVTSIITAAIVFFTLKETWKPKEQGEAQESMVQTFRGYGKALRDSAFVWYIVASMLMVLVYMNMNTTLSVYLRDVHGVNERGFSYILSLNAAMVVLFQFPITRWVNRYRPLAVMAAGTLLYAVGFAMYGLVASYVFFLVAMAIITVGEMMVSPVGQAIVTRLAPEDIRGRYMAVFGFSWIIPVAVGPFLAGLVLDNLNPHWLWYAAGILGIVAAAAFYLLEHLVNRAAWSAIDRRLRIVEQVEDGKLTAETAASMLAGAGDNAWTRLSPVGENAQPQHMRIRVSDLNTGMMKVDLRLPVGLVNTVLYVGGQFSADLGPAEAHLRDLLQQGGSTAGPQSKEAGDDRLEVDIE